MKCTYPTEGSLLIQYILNLLDEDDRRRFEDHVMTCEACRAELAQADPGMTAIGASRAYIVEALHGEGISFERLKRELLSAKRKKGILQEFFSDLSALVVAIFRNKKLVSAAGIVAVVLITALLLKGPKQDNAYLTLLSFDKFVYQELPTRSRMPESSANRLFAEGMKAYNDNDFENAIESLMGATQEAPNEWSYWFFLGVSYYLNRQAEPAITALLEADVLNQYALEIEVKWYLGQAYLLNNDPGSAIPYLQWLDERPGGHSAKVKALMNAIQEGNNPQE